MSHTASGVEQSVAACRRVVKNPVKVGVILGTGAGGFTGGMTRIDGRMPYGDITGMPSATVESHAGEMIACAIDGVDTVVFSGRFHGYEGYTQDEITLPVRLIRALGAEYLVICTGAVGGLNPRYALGDIVLVEDHINLMGVSPLAGPNDDALGSRWPDMVMPYDYDLIVKAESAAMDLKIRTHRGVYAGVMGPNLETRAEYRALRLLGADVVGMSTVPEVIVAVHAGLKTLAICAVSDMCLPDALEPVDINRLLSVAMASEPKITAIAQSVIASLA